MDNDVTFQISLTWALVVITIALLIFVYSLLKESQPWKNVESTKDSTTTKPYQSGLSENSLVRGGEQLKRRRDYDGEYRRPI